MIPWDEDPGRLGRSACGYFHVIVAKAGERGRVDHSGGDAIWLALLRLDDDDLVGVDIP